MTRRKRARIRRAINRWSRIVAQREGGGAAGERGWNQSIANDWGSYPRSHAYADGPRWSREWGMA